MAGQQGQGRLSRHEVVALLLGLLMLVLMLVLVLWLRLMQSVVVVARLPRLPFPPAAGAQ